MATFHKQTCTVTEVCNHNTPCHAAAQKAGSLPYQHIRHGYRITANTGCSRVKKTTAWGNISQTGGLDNTAKPTEATKPVAVLFLSPVDITQGCKRWETGK